MVVRHLDLFSGIGGFSIAASWTGKVEAAGFCEIDPWCRRVLAKHWPGVPQHDDIQTLTADIVRGWGSSEAARHSMADTGITRGSIREVPAGYELSALGRETSGTSRSSSARREDESTSIDLITGGYPCQPFSLAGQRRGSEDDRHLWPEMRRVINEIRPRYVLAENVVGHVSMGLDTVLAELEADGYACQAVVIPACAVNALHRRDRIWIMAYAAGSTSRSRSERTGRSESGRDGDSEIMGYINGIPDSNRGNDYRRTEPGNRRPDGVEIRNRTIESVPDTIIQRQQGPGEYGNTGDSAEDRKGQADHAFDDGHRPKGDETSRTLDASIDGIPAGLVRRLASRSAWRDGSWEMNLPRVVSEEQGRKQKLMAAGNAIVPAVAYEILSVMLGDE